MDLSEYELQQKIRIEADHNSNYYLEYKRNLSKFINKNLSREDEERVLAALNFSENLEYSHHGLSKNQYLVHPIRVVNTILEKKENISRDLLVLALLHNVIEVTKITRKKIEDSFGKKISDAIDLLTVDRKIQWKKNYKDEYYNKINNADEIVSIVKIFDKLDNIYLLCTNRNNKTRIMYLNEIEKYIIPMTSKYAPSVTKMLESTINFSNKDGYISIDDLLLKYRVQINQK